MRPSTTLYDRVRIKSNLRKAWAKVRQKGLASKSYKTREETKTFELRSETHLNTIQKQLQKRKFAFSPAQGIAQPKPGKADKRPIVISQTRDRVVQRAILNVLQDHKPLGPFFQIETSFGGIKDRGVPDAMRMLHEEIGQGCTHFIRSDIKSFFTKIPKSEVTSKIDSVVDDVELLNLFSNAIHTDLANLTSLSSEDRGLFPLFDVGVAQGSSLSPLAGNILLSDFDREMNQGDIRCIRYIDDFILLGPSEKAVNAAFRRAIKLLAEFDLEAYSPATNPDKAESGSTSSMFTFLGCDVRPGMIQPGKKTRRRLLKNVQDTLNESAAMMGKPDLVKQKRLSVIETLISTNNIMLGWGNQYAFCNSEQLMSELDLAVDSMISGYLSKYRNAHAKQAKTDSKKHIRRLLGVHLLSDSKRTPIIQTSGS